jgi:hypothetical protein
MFSNMRGGLRRDSVVRSRFADGVLYVVFPLPLESGPSAALLFLYL